MKPGKEDTLQKIRNEVESHLAHISQLFVPGTKLTLLVRNPDLPESSLFLTEDTPDEVVKAVKSFVVKE